MALPIGLYVPEHVQADMEREAMADKHIARGLLFDSYLKQIDSRLELVWVKERATAPGLVPGRWHIRRLNDETLDTYIPLVGPNGEYTEPHSGHLEALKRGDLWNRNVVAELRKEREASERATQKAKQEVSEERIDTMATHIKSRLNPSVSFSDARPWTNRIKPLPGE